MPTGMASKPSMNLPAGLLKRISGHTVFVFDDVVKSDQDKSNYRYLTLPNGLKVLLVSETGLDKSGAALDIHVGNFDDPAKVPGLAHFLEHLLFMGTKKYPDENDYGQYLSSHGGHSNAFTAEEHTNYFFEITSEYLDGALDRFAQFFIAPLFNPSGTERELLAVDSEHKKNLKNDHWRLNQLEKFLSNEDHPYSHFGTGNLETLREGPLQRGEDIRKVLVDFYERHYSANLMRLVIYGRESLDELETMALDKFIHVPNYNIQLTEWKGQPLDHRHFGKLIKVKTIKELRSLYLVWQLPDLQKFRLSKPEHYFTHLLGHEGRGSIISLLRSKSWATGLGAGVDADSRGYSFLQISIDLSPTGQDHVDEIIKIIFQYLQMLKAIGPQPQVYKENQKLEELAFRFMEKGSPSSFVYKTAGHLHYYSPELVLKGPRVSMVYDEEALELIFNSLTPLNFRAILASSDSIDNALREQWYGTEYAIDELSASLMEFIKSPAPSPNLFLPAPNTFIPELLNAKQASSIIPIMHPNLIINEAEGQFKLWHKQDDLFKMPKGSFQFLLITPIAFASPRDFVRTYLFIELLRDGLTELLYEAEMAGLNFDIGQSTDGVYFSFYGYDEKLPVLLDSVIRYTLAFKGNPERFVVYKDKYDRWLKSLVHDTPYSLISYYLSGLQLEKHWWHWEKQKELQTLQVEDIDSVAGSIFNGMGIEALCHGNYEQHEAEKIFENLRKLLSSPDSGQSKRAATNPIRTIALAPGQNLIFSPSPISNINSAIEFYLQIGSLGDLRLRALTLLFTQIFHESFFDLLRTREQLGYVVRHQAREKGSSIGLQFVIQSEHDPVFLDGRIESFISHIPVHLSMMSNSDFVSHVTALVNRLLAKKRKLSDETQVYWNQILLHQYEFERVYADAAYLAHLSLDDIIQFVHEFVLRDAPQRKKFVIHLWGERLETQRKEAYSNLDPSIQLFEDPHEVQKAVRFFPPAYSLSNIHDTLQHMQQS